ncbi:MAG: PAS domain-containing protein [Alphaproteobacteria bacterium]|nr:PAS domain-containing protein [Alphaproteobacteria bacterium]
MDAGKAKVLVIESDRAFSDVLVAALSAAPNRPAEIMHADDLRTGLAKLDRERPDTLFLSLSLSDVPGLDAYRAVAARMPHLPTIGIIPAGQRTMATSAIVVGLHEVLERDECTPEALARAIEHAAARQRRRTTVLGFRPDDLGGDDALRAIHENLPGTIFRRVMDAEGRVTYPYISPSRALADVGVTLRPDFGAAMARTNADDREPFAEAMKESARNLTPFDAVRRVMSDFGEERWIRSIAQPRRMANGEIVWDGLTLDITEQKRAEEVLRQTEQRLQSIVNNMPGGLFRRVLHPDGRITFPFSTDYLARRFGLVRTDGNGLADTLTDAIYPEDVASWREAVETSAKELKPFDAEYRIQTERGGVRWVRSIATVQAGTAGEVIWDGVTLDVTEAKHMREELQETQERFASVAANLPADVFRRVRHPDGRISFPYSSAFMERAYGVKRKETQNDPYHFINAIHPDDRNRWLKAVEDSAASLKPFNLEYRIVRDTGDISWVRGLAGVRRLPNGDTVWDGITLDLTDQRLAEQALRETEERLASIAANLPGGVFRRVLHSDGKMSFPYSSEYMEREYGIGRAAVQGDARSFIDSIHEDDRQGWIDAVKASARDVAPFDLAYRIIAASGEMRWVHTNASVRRAENGDVIWDGITLDVTEQKRAEEALRQTQRLLHDIAANVPGVIFRRVMHVNGEISYPFVAGRERPPRAERGGNLLTAAKISNVHPDDIDKWRADILDSARTLRPLDTEFRVMSSRGDTLWVRSASKPRRMESGDIAWDGIQLDITAGKEAQIRLESVVANLPGAVYRRVLRSDGILALTYISPRAKEIFGFDAERMMSETDAYSDVVHPDDLEAWRVAVQRSAERMERFDMAVRVGSPETGYRWSRTMSQPRRDGEDIVWDGLIIDIDDAKRAELALQERETLLGSVNANLAGVIFQRVLHRDGSTSYRYISERAKEFYGREPADLMVDPAHIGLTADEGDRAIYRQKLYESARTLKPLRWQGRETMPNGAMRWVEVFSMPRRMENGDTLWDGMTLDITDRKRAEEALAAAIEAARAASTAKSQFLANISHELRTPLSAILGFSEMLKDGLHGPLGAPEYVEYSRLTYESGVHLLDLVNSILDMARIEAGRYELQFGKVDFSKLANTCVAMVKPAASNKSVRLENKISKPLIALHVDEGAAKQILLNLLSNAVKFTTPDGTVSIRGSNGEGGIDIAISDTGIGIRPEDLSRIGQPFQQVDASFTRQHGGAGLGLSISRKLVELHGGTLTIESELGVGTTVTVRFPAPQ